MALQGNNFSLQGNSPSLQGASALGLQGSNPSLQQATPTVTKPVVSKPAQIAAIKSPAQQTDLSSLYGLSNGTVYNKQTNTAFSKPEDFFNESGQKSFDNIKFDTLYKPASNTAVYGQMPTNSSTPPPASIPASTPPTPTGPSYAEQLKVLQNKVLSSYDTSPDELTALNEVTNKKNQLAEFEGNARLGISGLEGQGRGIPLKIIKGQQGKLLEQANIQDQTLQQQLANLQAKQTALKSDRESSLKKATTELGFAQGEKPTEVSAGASLVRFNPQTGKYENEFTAPTTPTKPTLPASAQEYEYAKQQGYKGNYEQYQTEDANRKRSITNINTGSGLTPGQVNTTVNQIAGAFDNEPTVREYNTVANTLAALKNAGTSPTDDIQRVYAFAKIADPSSAVKEGEYNTIQEYSTALFKRLGINVARAFDERGFLTDSARNSMSTTLNNILQAKKNAYDNVAKEYQRQIDDAYAGKPRQLTNYSGATTSSSGGGDPLGVR